MMKYKKFFLILQAVLSVAFIFATVSFAANPVHFTGVKTQPTSCAYAGAVTLDGVAAVDGEDEAGVYVSDGAGGEILVGACVMGQVMAGNYFVNIYGDDTSTTQKDGAANNEELVFKVWDKSADKEFTISSSSMTAVFETGLTLPVIPPRWTDATTFGLLNLSAVSNQPPVLNPIGSKAVNENAEISFVVSGSDPEGGDPVFSTGVLPAGALFDAQSRTFTWTPSYDDAGTYQVEFIVTDDGEPPASCSETVTITVNNVNRSPSLDLIGDKTVDENSLLQFTITACDPDADSYAFSSANLPEGATLNTSTGVFSWMPGYEQSGEYTVTVTVTDTGSPSLSGSGQFSITVNDINRPPVLDAIGNKAVDEGCLLMFEIAASDPDGNDLTFSFEPALSGASFSDGTTVSAKLFSWVPGFQNEGTYEITFRVTDNGAPQMSDSEVVTIAVNNAPSHFTDTISLTPDSMDIYGYAFIGEYGIDKNDEIGIFDVDGRLCGMFIVSDPGSYGIVHIYGDDSTTADIKEGPVQGERLTIKIYDISEERTYVAGITNLDPPEVNFVSQGSLQVDLKTILKQNIPLHTGWNLISFGVNKCYYVDAQPAVSIDMIDGIEYEKVSSISDILSSIEGQYSYVKGFDVAGARSYNLSPWSDMKYMAAGYGYWIKVNNDAAVDENGLIYLKLEGSRVAGNKPISLHPGWNLAGYLGNKVQYKDAEPAVHFPEDCEMTLLASGKIGDIFWSIDGRYSYVKGFDATGAKSYNLSIWSDMKYVGPGYGYWVKVDEEESPTLVWED